MPDEYANAFLQQVTEVIMEHLSDEQFGVSELAGEIGMSRSNLLRKLKKSAGVSASRFIRETRLKQAMEILGTTGRTVSEISYEVGFSSTSYFVKCFREYYGYPPGEVGKAQSRPAAGGAGRTHQLAAIMFTDIQGYTALMQQDEEKALAFRSRHRDVFNETTKKYKGRILQYYGDGTLSTFQSAIDAVHCGIELQLAFGSEPRIPVRIGIHTGDILFSDEEIIGDGVNVASRIESLAAAGSVFISGKVYDEVKNQQDIRTVPLGTFSLKNVKKPIEVYAVSNPGLVVPEKGQANELPDPANEQHTRAPARSKALAWLLWLLIIVTGIIGGYLLNDYLAGKRDPALSAESLAVRDKSIAVLPFINDSNDSTNVYLVNGLMESILNNLQQIGDLRVVSRTSVEQYRNTKRSLPEIARELNVRYLIEGSGQKVGNQVLLNIQLVEGQADAHLWSQQYNREVTDIFRLQAEIARQIADEIEVMLTPSAAERIEKVQTQSPEAYDAFLKGLDLSYRGNEESLRKATEEYERAISLDSTYARAYAALAIAYYYLDYYGAEKSSTSKINFFADKAILYDPGLAQGQVAKALYYIHSGDAGFALPHLEKAHSLNPNSALVLNILSDYYTRFVPDTEKYLEYALKGARLNPASSDSVTASITFLHISNALIQSGFIDEAEYYINKSISYDPENLFSAYVKPYIQFARNKEIELLKDRLIEVFERDTTRLDVMQEVGKACYFLRDYEQASHYYKRFADLRDAYRLDIYRVEDIKIANVMRQVGRETEAARFLDSFNVYTHVDHSIYKPLNQATAEAYRGNTEAAIDFLGAFSAEDHFHYWVLLFLERDPLMDGVKVDRRFRKIMQELESTFWKRHEETRRRLKGENLI